jgi:hypothetical protein
VQPHHARLLFPADRQAVATPEPAALETPDQEANPRPAGLVGVADAKELVLLHGTVPVWRRTENTVC